MAKQMGERSDTGATHEHNTDTHTHAHSLDEIYTPTASPK